MAIPVQLPCEPWTDEDRVNCLCPDLADVSGPCADPEAEPVPATYAWDTEELIRIASRILFERTCRRFPGICEGQTLRPCDPCKTCADCCTCRYHYVPLAGPYPVTEIESVFIDGVEVPSSSYRLDEYSRLVRIDGEHWPKAQDLSKDPASDADTFLITYSAGRSIPDDLQYAAALLACELKRACDGQGCRLPERVQSVTRDGVSYQVLDSAEIAFNGSFGVPLIDSILKGYPCKDGRAKPQMTNRIMHPLLDNKKGVRG